MAKTITFKSTDTARERARATREYRSLRALASHKLAMAEHPRTGMDTAMRLRDEADSLYATARELAETWNLRRTA